MKRKRLPLPELNLGDVGFRLVGESGTDPDRIVREEAARQETERARAAFHGKAQLTMEPLQQAL
jgi:hypothetical protein